MDKALDNLPFPTGRRELAGVCLWWILSDFTDGKMLGGLPSPDLSCGERGWDGLFFECLGLRLCFFPFFFGATPVVNGALAAAGEGEFVGGAIAGDDAACACGGTVANVDGGDQNRVGTDADAFADDGAVFVYAIVVGGDGACADVAVLADVGIADVA